MTAPDRIAALDSDLARAGLPPLPRTAWAAVDLDRLAANLAVLRGVLPPGTRIEPVVKADAYGHGAVPVALALEAAGADGFGVATFDEALELRAGGVERPILVLYPVPAAVVPDAGRARVAITLGDTALLERTLAAVPWSLTPPLDVHVELETGLGRGGLNPSVALEVARRIAAHPSLHLAGVWSHLGGADDPDRSRRQRDAFEGSRAEFGEAGVAVRQWHLAASGGLLAASAHAYDAVRPGLALYGVVPEGLPVAAGRIDAAAALAPVLSLRAQPVRVAELPAGVPVGYGASFVPSRPTRIATLPIGYGDGYQRALSNRASVLVRGVRAPVVGTVAMDAVMVDVTDVPGPPVSVDDAFVLLGEQGSEAIRAADLALLGTTISWEVLAGMARRLPRVYYAGAVPVGIRTLTTQRGTWRTSTGNAATDATRRSADP